jgi:Putative Flp pilus-assembly TadE/G-like
MVLPALAMVTLGAVEVAEVFFTRSKLQTVVDMAALKGAGELGIDLSSATTERTKAYADSMADPTRLRWTVTSSAVLDSQNSAMTVSQAAHRPSFFRSLLPPGGWNLNVSAKAIRYASGPLCVLGIQSGGGAVVGLDSSGALNAAGCLVQSNSDLTAMGGAAVTAGDARAAGGASGAISPTPLTGTRVMSDPFAALNIAYPAGCDTTSITSTSYLNPGLHCGDIKLSGNETVTLAAGEHYFTGGSLKMGGNAQIVGTDVVVFLKDFGSINFNGNAGLSLEGRKGGSFAGFALIADRSFTGTLELTAKNVRKMYGTVYLPNATLLIGGNGNKVSDQSPWTVVIANKLQVTDKATLHINSNYAGASVPVPQGVGPSTKTSGTRLAE